MTCIQREGQSKVWTFAIGLNQPFTGHMGPRIGWLGCFGPRPNSPHTRLSLLWGCSGLVISHAMFSWPWEPGVRRFIPNLAGIYAPGFGLTWTLGSQRFRTSLWTRRRLLGGWSRPRWQRVRLLYQAGILSILTALASWNLRPPQTLKSQSTNWIVKISKEPAFAAWLMYVSHSYSQLAP